MVLFRIFVFFSLVFLESASCFTLCASDFYQEQIEPSFVEKTPSRSPYDPITPSGGPRVERGFDMFLLGKFFYWKAKLDTFTFGRSASLSLTDPASSQRTMQGMNWKWDPGFQVGLGWNFAHGDWDLQLKYTWFYTKARKTVTDPIHPSFELALTQLISIAQQASNLWYLYYQLGDFDLGRNFSVHRYLQIRPFIGIKGTWQKQRDKMYYTNLTIGTDNFFAARTTFQNTLWGLGPRLGLGSFWPFVEGVGLYGNFALSGLWLRYTTQRTSRLQTELATSEVAPLKAIFRIVKPLIEFECGFRFAGFLSGSQLHLALELGWETHIWPSQTFYLNLRDQINRFDLLLYGGIAKLRFDF